MISNQSVLDHASITHWALTKFISQLLILSSYFRVGNDIRRLTKNMWIQFVESLQSSIDPGFVRFMYDKSNNYPTLSVENINPF